MSGEQTSETQARARRWFRRERLAAGIALVGIALPFVTLLLGVLLTNVNGDGSFVPFFWWAVGAAAVLLVVAAVLEVHAQGRLGEAKFADGYTSAGMVDEVIEEPSSEIGGISTSTIMITAEVSGQVTIRRRLYSPEYPAGPGTRVGQTMIFRHTTLDPDDLQDVRFVRFVGAA